MRLIRVYSNKEEFKEVLFNPTGLSLIVAQQKDRFSNERGDTYNGVGKSLLVKIIHFCFGSDVKNYLFFCEKLPGWEFYIDISIDDTTHTVMRSTNNPSRILLDGKKLSLNKFKQELKSAVFNIDEEISFLSFRTLLPFFIRPNKKSYVEYDDPAKAHTEYQIKLTNSFLIGLDVFLAEKKMKLKKEKKRIKELESNFRKDSLLKDFFIGYKDVELTLTDLNDRIEKLEKNLKNFQVAEDYHDIQLEADKIENEMFALNNQIILMQNNIDNIEKSLKIRPSSSKDDIERIYEEVKIYFSQQLSAKLDELEVFYDKLVSNRLKRLTEQKVRLRNEVDKEIKKLKLLENEFDELLKYLGDHQALDVFVSLNDQITTLKTERNTLNRYRDLQSEYRNRLRDIDRIQLEDNEETEDYLKDIESEIAGIKEYFRGLAKKFYPNSVAGLSIHNNDGNNQLRYDIKAEIASDGSDGIGNVKIFCYDLMMLFKGQNHSIDFIFHDSRLFDGIDERQKAEIFRIAYDEFTDTNKQYIATVNQNQLEEIERILSPEEYNKIITQNTILTLTDQDDSGKLLGITIDIKDE